MQGARRWDGCPGAASPVPGALLPTAPCGTEGGGSESRQPARAVAERGAGGAAAVVFEPRSPKLERLGGGEGVGAGWGRGPGRPEGGGGARRGLRRRRVRAIAGQGQGRRGEPAGKRAGATVNAKLFN